MLFIRKDNNIDGQTQRWQKAHVQYSKFTEMVFYLKFWRHRVGVLQIKVSNNKKLETIFVNDFPFISFSAIIFTCVREFFLCVIVVPSFEVVPDPCLWTRLLMEPTSLLHSCCSFWSGGDVPSHSTVGFSRAIFEERILIILYRFVCICGGMILYY